MNRSVEESLAHCRALGVTQAVLLGGAGQDEASPATRLLRGHGARFVAFTREDPRQAEAPARLRADLRAGAIGIGEQKSAVAIDGPEMRMVYDIAAEHRVPVLLHIGGEDNSGYERFPAILKRYASVIFIGHATGFWGHISADYDGTTGYPTGPVKPGGSDRSLAGRIPEPVRRSVGAIRPRRPHPRRRLRAGVRAATRPQAPVGDGLSLQGRAGLRAAGGEVPGAGVEAGARGAARERARVSGRDGGERAAAAGARPASGVMT